MKWRPPLTVTPNVSLALTQFCPTPKPGIIRRAKDVWWPLTSLQNERINSQQPGNYRTSENSHGIVAKCVILMIIIYSLIKSYIEHSIEHSMLLSTQPLWGFTVNKYCIVWYNTALCWVSLWSFDSCVLFLLDLCFFCPLQKSIWHSIPLFPLFSCQTPEGTIHWLVPSVSLQMSYHCLLTLIYLVCALLWFQLKTGKFIRV